MIDALPPQPPGEAILVTGRALADPAADRAFAVDGIGQAALRNAPSAQLEQVLEQVPGLQLFRRSDARSGHPTSQGVTIRGLGGNASSRALLVLDGVPQADPFGGWVNWPVYDPAALDEVRVIRGGGSVDHGPGALAGTILMSSRSTPALEAGADFGSRQSLELRGHAGTAIGGGVLAVTGRAARGDGFVPVTRGTRGPADTAAPYQQASLRGRWVAPLSANIEAQASVSAFTDRRDRGVAFTGNRTDGADASLRLVGGGPVPWSGVAYVQARELSSSFASVSPGRTVATRVSLQDAVPSRAYGGSVEIRPQIAPSLELRVGGDARLTSGESRELFSYVAGEPTRRRIAGGETLTAGAFGELTLDAGTLSLSGGMRLDHWRISSGRLHERLLATGAPLREDRYAGREGWLPTARAAGQLELGGGAAMRSAAYLGWRMATLNELFRPFRAGADATAANALLEPERLAGIEAGLDFRRGGLELSGTVFANRLSDGIANVTLGQGPGTFPAVGFVGASGEYRQRRNLEAIEVRGAEASAQLRRGAWSIRGGASLVDAQVEAGGLAAAIDGLRPAQTPRVTLTGTIAWEDGRRIASLGIRHVGSQYEDDLNKRGLPPATTLDAFLAWPLTRALQALARAENLFDEAVVAGIGGDGSIEIGTPRTLWIGLRFGAPGRR